MEKSLRFLILLVTGFIALTTIMGGIAILTGLDKFPLEWLKGGPFHNYVLPALILAIVVGGTSLLATVLLLLQKSKATTFSLIAGGTMMGFILGEIFLLAQEPPGPTFLEKVYFGLGLLVVGLSIMVMKRARKVDSNGPEITS